MISVAVLDVPALAGSNIPSSSLDSQALRFSGQVCPPSGLLRVAAKRLMRD
jgi:hypothetical protein